MAILGALRDNFPHLRQVSCYAMATNILAKSDEELRQLRAAGLDLLYIGPESGDDVVLKRIAKGSDFAAHAEAAQRAHSAGMRISAICSAPAEPSAARSTPWLPQSWLRRWTLSFSQP